MNTLVAVAERARARLFHHEGPGKGLSEIGDLAHPEARMHGLELDTDRPGRVHDRKGPGRHAMSSEESTKERAASNFAREVAQAIKARRTHEGFGRLVLVAEPGFLGMLRAALDPATSKLVDGEVHKQIVARPTAEIAAHLAEVLVV